MCLVLAIYVCIQVQVPKLKVKLLIIIHVLCVGLVPDPGRGPTTPDLLPGEEGINILTTYCYNIHWLYMYRITGNFRGVYISRIS